MGFSYGYWGLCCDFCGAQRNTRKYVKKLECPYGYCQAWACCDKCRAEKKHMQSSCTNEIKTHKEECLPRMIEFEAEKLRDKGINVKVINVKCRKCKGQIGQIEYGSKFSLSCINPNCKNARSFEELQSLQNKVMEASA